MRRASIPLAVLLLALSASAEDLIRNPFWPHGFQGRRYPISETPRYPSVQPVQRPSKASEAGDETSTVGTNATASASTSRVKPSRYTSEDAENAMWNDARAKLRFNDTFSFERDGKLRQTVRINGRLYSDGDLISINNGPRRFTWLVLGVGTNNTVRLQRMRHRELNHSELNDGDSTSK